MTARDGTDAGWLDDTLRWLHGLANQLGQSAADMSRIADRLEGCWMDERGKEWVERAGLVQRQLDRDAAAWTEFSGRVERAWREHTAANAHTDDELSRLPSVVGGPLLGSTAARRADAARGMRIATLWDDGSTPSGDR